MAPPSRIYGKWFEEECNAYRLDPKDTTLFDLDVTRYGNKRGVRRAGVKWRDRE